VASIDAVRHSYRERVPMKGLLNVCDELETSDAGLHQPVADYAQEKFVVCFQIRSQGRLVPLFNCDILNFTNQRVAPPQRAVLPAKAVAL
jgi:hypothetical protein